MLKLLQHCTKDVMKILVIETITTLHTDIKWAKLTNAEVEFELLEDFDHYFYAGNIEASLQYATPIVMERLTNAHYNVIILYSKGVALASLLVSMGIWKGPMILLSPIPNSCSHLMNVQEDKQENTNYTDEIILYEHLWASIMKIFKESKLSICICYGDSVDEKLMIEDYIGGDKNQSNVSNVSNMKYRQVHGSHDWVKDHHALSIIEECLKLVVK